MKEIYLKTLFSALLLVCFGCSNMKEFYLDANARGCIETVDNIQNLTIVSKHENDFKAEYRAGFVQGRLQKKYIASARDNTWDLMFLLDTSHAYPGQLPPSKDELEMARDILIDNYIYTVDYITNHENPEVQKNLKRLLFRMLGIYHGATLCFPASLDFEGSWLPDLDYFEDAELSLGYETSALTWLDIYFLNANFDIGDVIAFADNIKSPYIPPKCSAFVKRTDKDIFITHNSWYGYLAQSLTVNVFVNDDFWTFNAIFPGIIGSNTDFGYNNKGIMFNETTHHATYSEAKVESLWNFWRSAAAEQFSSSIDEFFEYISLEASGTYMNGYMVADVNTEEIGLVEMSYKNFVFFRSSSDGYEVSTKPEGLSTEYDSDLVQPNYILGINYPASFQIRDDLKAVDTRPARKRQFMEKIGDVVDIESAKELITYTDPENPLSIYGRWDLGSGETPYPQTIPDGAIDAKAASMNDALNAMGLEGVFDKWSKQKGFWMKYGTAEVEGEPFIWSKSQWSGQKLRDVPDRVGGSFNLMNLYMR